MRVRKPEDFLCAGREASSLNRLRRMHIHDATFVVVDTETTGTKKDADRVLEIGAVKVRGGEVVGRFSELINPGRSVPHRITKLTGITTGMVFEAPPAREVVPRFLDFLGDAVLVAHNAPFDLGFLKYELARLGRPPLTNATLCTLRLARRLLPGLRSKGLGYVADFYGIQIRGRHRALGDAEATAEILRHFLKQLTFEHELGTVGELLAFQRRPYSRKGREPKHLPALRERAQALPERPGIYFMKDRQGTIVYIGKAKDLRARVRTYFTAIEAHPPRLRKLVETVRTVDYEETGSELGALLLESKMIKEKQPRFNRAQRRYRNRPFIRLDTAHEAPSVSFTPYLLNDGAEYFGPLGGRRQAELVVQVIDAFYTLRGCSDEEYAEGRRCLYVDLGRCEAPCAGDVTLDAYADEVERVRAFLMGRDSSVLSRLEASMREAAARLAFEEAARYRDWLRRLERMLAKQEQVAAPVLQHNAVLVQPGVEQGTVQLFFVRFGRLAETVTIPATPSEDDAKRLRRRLSECFDPALPRPERYFKPEVDEIRILSHWMYVHRRTARAVRWTPETELDTFLERVLSEVDAVAQALDAAAA